MKNNLINLFLIFFLNFLVSFASSAYEQFNFDITEIEIVENGNKYIGKKRGKVSTNDGIIIEGDTFNYDKSKNEINVTGDVILKDNLKDYILKTQDITYFKNEEKIITKNLTEIFVKSKYVFTSKNVKFLRNENKFSSNSFSTILDNNDNFYELKRFIYLLDKKILKGEKVKITTNYQKEKSDTFFHENAFIDLDKKIFTGNQTEIILHKNIFDKEREKFINLENEKLNELFDDYYEENEPRLKGISSKGNDNTVVIKKGVFTSCKKNDNCPAWSLSSEKITHDKVKKQLIYDDTVLRIYDYPVFYFPKFFHPDPTVDRQSGFLRPQTNNSKILGSSLYTPYYHVISDNRDFTFKPTIFDSSIYMFQNEYRQKNKNSSFIADIALTKGYQSSVPNSNTNSIGHLFAKYDLDLKIKNFTKSDLKVFVEKVTKDTYLNIFENNLFNTPLKPSNYSQLHTGLNLDLDNEKFNLTSGLSIYENLSGANSDRFQYVLPFYDFQTEVLKNDFASINFNSSGNNSLQNTNNLRSRIVNNINLSTFDYFTNFGFKNNLNFNFKNLNTVAKNDSIYKSTPQINTMGILEFQSSLPMIRSDKREEIKFFEYLTPKISFRASPNDMKNYSSENRRIDANNIFELNRLGLSDSVEPGRSITLGLDYRKEDINDIEKYFELKLATTFRDVEEKDIPITSTLNQKNSNIFGSITNNLNEHIKIDYNFALDNDWKTFEYNSLGTEFSINNFVTEFQFTKAQDEMGSENSIGNTTSIKFNNNNYFTFNTRRNREINLTEYYDFVYEYKNDCLTAGVKYKKTYYSNSDLKPNEDFLFTITLFPLTTLEQAVDNNLYR